MKVRILGSGTSSGVPQVGCQCEVCRSEDIRDRRLRCSSLLTVGKTHILIDCGPDFREQMLHVPFHRIDGVLITHEHYDHVGGIDDLRPFCKLGSIPLYGDEKTCEALRQRMPYCFTEHLYPGVPKITLNVIEPFKSFRINNVDIMPITVMHGKMPILGFRIGDLGYVTDMLTMPDKSFDILRGVDTLIMNALRILPHPTHQSLDEALETVKRISPRRTYFVHMSHQMGLHRVVNKQLPHNIRLAYDTQTFNI